jgi:hypothetical protein
MGIRILSSVQCLRASLVESVFEQHASLGGDGYLNREILRCDEMGDHLPNFGLTFLCSRIRSSRGRLIVPNMQVRSFPPAIIDLCWSSRMREVHCSGSASIVVVAKHWATRRDPFGGVNTRYGRMSPRRPSCHRMA